MMFHCIWIREMVANLRPCSDNLLVHHWMINQHVHHVSTFNTCRQPARPRRHPLLLNATAQRSMIPN